MKKPPSAPVSTSKRKIYIGSSLATNNISSPYLQPVAPKNNNNVKPATPQQQQELNSRRELKFKNELDENFIDGNNFEQNEENYFTEGNNHSAQLHNSHVHSDPTAKKSHKPSLVQSFQSAVLGKIFRGNSEDDDDYCEGQNDNTPASSSSIFLSSAECTFLDRMLISSTTTTMNVQNNKINMNNCCKKLLNLILVTLTWCVSYDCAAEEVKQQNAESDDDDDDRNENNDEEGNKKHSLRNFLALPLSHSFSIDDKFTEENDSGAFFIMQCATEMEYTRTPPLTSSIFRVLLSSASSSSSRKRQDSFSNDSNEMIDTDFAATTTTRGIISEFFLFLCWISQRYELSKLACVCDVLRNQKSNQNRLVGAISEMFDELFYSSSSSSSTNVDDDLKNLLLARSIKKRKQDRESILFSSSFDLEEKLSMMELAKMTTNRVSDDDDDENGDDQGNEDEDTETAQVRKLRFAIENLRIVYLKNKNLRQKISPYAVDDFISASLHGNNNHQVKHSTNSYLKSISNFSKNVQEANGIIKELAEICSVAALSSSRVVDGECVGKQLDAFSINSSTKEINKNDDDDDDDEQVSTANINNNKVTVTAKVIQSEKEILEEIQRQRRRNEIVLSLTEQISTIAKDTYQSVFQSWQTASQLGLDTKMLSSITAQRSSVATRKSSSSSASLRAKILQETSAELDAGNLSDFIRISLTKAATIRVDLSSSSSSKNIQQSTAATVYRPSEILSNILEEIFEKKRNEGLLSKKFATSGKNVKSNADAIRATPISIFETNLKILLTTKAGERRKMEERLELNQNDDDDETEENGNEKPNGVEKNYSPSWQRTNRRPIRLLTETPFDSRYRKTLRSDLVGETTKQQCVSD